MPRGNTDNLKPLSSEEARKNGSKGGKASVAKRRMKKNLLEATNALLSQRIGDGELAQTERAKLLIKSMGLDENDAVTLLAAAAIVYGTIEGSSQMAKLLAEMNAAGSGKAVLPATINVRFEDNSEAKGGGA